jgi:ERCC4-type nuclease
VNTATSRPIHVVVDDREVSSGIIPEFQMLGGVVISVRRLRVGDYIVDGKLLVERKTLTDFTASIIDGRLFRQASRLTSTPLARAIVLEGVSTDLFQDQMRREAIQGAIISLTLNFCIPLLRSRDPKESAHLMISAAKQLRRVPSPVLPRSGKRPKGKYKLQLHILQGLPGVGPERARRLLDTFGSIENVITAQAEQLARVSGIGTRTASRIRQSVTGG